MPSKLPPIAVRLRKLSFKKFNYIAYMNGRFAAQEARNILLRYIDQYELKNGTITLEQLNQFDERIKKEKSDK
jgi:hypothetical protein